MNERIKKIGQAIAIGGLLMHTGCVSPERAAAVAPTPQATQTPDQLYAVERTSGRYEIFSLSNRQKSISITLVPGDSSRRFIKIEIGRYNQYEDLAAGLVLAGNYCGEISDYTSLSGRPGFPGAYGYLARTLKPNCPQLIPGLDNIDPQLLPL